MLLNYVTLQNIYNTAICNFMYTGVSEDIARYNCFVHFQYSLDYPSVVFAVPGKANIIKC